MNGTPYRREFPEAASSAGCIEAIASGMTPNQAGTWWFGRGGWCPGLQVDPFVADVSAQALPGVSATLSYRGLLGNATPPDGAGNIELNSVLVIYE